MTLPEPSPNKRLTIRRQALIRLAGVMLVLMVGISVIGANSFHTRQQREITQKLEVTRSFYEQTLPRLETQWMDAAVQVKSRIEFTRILEGTTDQRWAALNTFLTAQSEFLDFSNLLVLSPQGRQLYHYGSESAALPATPDAIQVGWHYASGTGDMYRIIQTPIWLGTQGQGTLVLFKTFNVSTMQGLITPETHLHAYGFGRLVASSDPFMPQDGEPGREGLHPDAEPPVIQIDIRWPHSSPMAPTLVVHREFRDSISLTEFMLRPLAAIVMVALMLWLGLGRWLSRSVRRIESLESATHQYAESGSIAEASHLLAPAHTTHDEIDDVADTLENMMQRVQERDAEQRIYLETLAMLEEAVLELDCDGRVLHASPGWYRLTHCPDNIKGTSITEFIHRDDMTAMQSLCDIFKRREKSQAQLRLRLRNDTGVEQWAECRLIAQFDASGQLAGIRGVLRDITQTYLHEKQITHMALHDALTDLPNRVLLEDRIKIATRMASRSEQRVAICFIDLDHFKKINDSLGHKAGDRLLIAFASTLRSQLRAGDTLARWGGDEFVLLLPELANEEDARGVAHKIEAALRRPIRLDDSDYTVTFSMGVAMYPDDASEVEGLLSHADRAMFYAKTQGRNQTCFFGEITDKGGSKRELYVQNRLIEAVAAKRIEAWFQPIICAGTGKCLVVEVLARWHDEEFGWIGPATFIPIAESTGVIRDLGHQIWLQTLSALVDWREQGYNLRVAINVSKRQLFSGRFSEQLVGELASQGLSPEDVIIEVTESVALLDVAHASEHLADLHTIGFHIAIDDFGTGYSALSQLHEMPVDELKIDISFVRRIHEPAGLSMVQAIIHLSKALGLKTIAEGVEDEATATLLTSLGVDYLQGYYFAKPMPRKDFEQWLKDHPAAR
jgi:diguanylate cyclase (GGDEF)-like protein/PAS domain S-box-containing protein